MLINGRRSFVFFDREDGSGSGNTPSTEEEILNQVDLGPDEGAQNADEETGGTPAVETPKAGSGEPAKTTGVADVAGTVAGGPVVADADEQIGRAVGASKEGHLIDAAGKVVASAGKERRLYEGMHSARNEAARATAELTSLKEQNATLSGQVNAFEATNTAAKQLGLAPEESLMAMQLISAYKTNPIETLKYMLTEAKAAGHNVEGLENASLDMGAVGRMLDEKLNPILQDRENATKQAEFTQGIREEVQTFFSTHPDAVIHEDTIAQLIDKDNTLSIREAYLTLQNFAIQRGFDWGQDLRPQLEAQINGVSGGKPIPSGRAGTVNVTNASGDTPVASENDSYESIVRDSMREAGMQID